ncbi:MAG: hypothetical protein ABMA25_28425 [Ilumatobacteraceae bacterium]
MHRSAARHASLVAALGLATLTLAACSDDGVERTEANYCARVSQHAADLNSPALTTDADIDRLLSAWRSVAAAAPLAIEPEWATMVANIETAVTVDPADPASMQRVADTARASEQAATRVIVYTQDTCGVLIGTVAPTATTVAPAAAETTTTAAG